MISSKKYLLIGLVVMLIVGLLVFSFWPQPITVSTAKVERGPLQVTVEEEGKTRVRERYQISAPVAGYAPRLEWEVGDSVEADQVLLLLQPTPATVLDPRSRAEARAQVERARAALAAEQSQLRGLQANYELAQREYIRIKTLFEDGKISRSALDQAETEVERTAANLHAAHYRVDVYRQELRAAQAVLEYSAADPKAIATEEVPITSPVTGQVLEIHHKSAGIVSSGQLLLTVGDSHSLEVAVDVLSADAVRIRPGMGVSFQRWGDEQPLEGRVRTVEPAGFTKVSALGVEEQRVWVVADITSPPHRWQALGDGYRVEASFILWESNQVLKVPSSALFRQGEEWAVFIIEDGVAHRRIIKIGHRGGLEVEVLEGLSEGDTVIIHPQDTVEDEVRVEPRANN